MGALHDAYELGGVAGHGRTAVVRLGVRRGDASPVALKQLRSDHAQDLDKRRRFVAQARRASMLQHESIETVVDVVEGIEGPVVVAEWIDGRSLERLAIRRRRNEETWSPEEVVLVARCLLEALRYAHHQPTAFDAHGMLHGGLWPGNVLVDVDGNVKLVDFGMASVWQDAPDPWQDLEALRYLSADHMLHGATAASDLFAVGAIVHELLSGQRFRAEHQTEVEMRAAIEQPEPPERPREDLPLALERLRRRLLEPVQSSRLTLEHMLDLCVAFPLGDARATLRQLVRDTLRNDSTAPEPDTPPRGTPRMVGPELEPDIGIAKEHERPSAAAQLAAGGGRGLGIALQQVPLGQTPRRPRGRDPQSVPIPLDHERTVSRKPMHLQQTALPGGETSRNAERERSGGGERSQGLRSFLDAVARAARPTPDEMDVPPIGGRRPEGAARRLTPQEVADVDTAPLPVADPDAAVPEAVPEPEDEPEPLLELSVTAEIVRPPQLPEDRDADVTTTLPIETHDRSRLWRVLQGPVGWALLGAAAVGIGVPLAARCGSDDPPSRSAGSDPDRR
jgi:serine/threonine protein kinase